MFVDIDKNRIYNQIYKKLKKFKKSRFELRLKGYIMNIKN
ncbi:hypothetical protein CLOHIR_02040 [Peptacetobacter hiranonis DSM 13275]|uniref:Uncharacterized protein n=1 Tax=Peptacetobacter hiranonis (strain DSM 13275 / JCM 10541 / KCTC 15199 / TO-931) TaxID=500633 RepID=B6G1N3_PEPHT|nr:hypothetical protein CLOHIR_02040 [Peptacetobacter hiranonis DSM 13275]